MMNYFTSVFHEEVIFLDEKGQLSEPRNMKTADDFKSKKRDEEKDTLKGVSKSFDRNHRVEMDEFKKGEEEKNYGISKHINDPKYNNKYSKDNLDKKNPRDALFSLNHKHEAINNAYHANKRHERRHGVKESALDFDII